MTDDTERDAKAVLRRWHADLLGRPDQPHDHGDRPGRAALRRAQSAEEVFEIPAFYRLRNPLAGRFGGRDELVLARIALAVAELDHDSEPRQAPPDATQAHPDQPPDPAEPDPTGDRRLGAALARPSAGKPRVSPQRLRLLANTEEPDLFLRLLRGMLVLAGRAAPVWDLAQTVRRWHFPAGRERARRELLLRYFENAPSEFGGNVNG